MVYDWFEERLEVQSIVDDVLSKFVPLHVNIFYCFGGVVFTMFLLQAISGFCMLVYYRPNVSEAFYSVFYIMFNVNLGWFIRFLHRWSSSLIILSLIVHLSRVYISGGFKKPRELTWLSGCLLVIISVLFGVTGYSLPWDQLGFWACKIVTSVPESLNELYLGLGYFIVLALRGGTSVTQYTLSRLFVIHTVLLPLVCGLLILIHFLLIRKQGISGPL